MAKDVGYVMDGVWECWYGWCLCVLGCLVSGDVMMGVSWMGCGVSDVSWEVFWMRHGMCEGC